MTTQEIIKGLENVLDYCRYHQDAPALREAIEMLKCSEIPNSSDERTDKRTGTHACDCISRQQAIDVARKCSVKEVTPAYMLIDKAEVMTDLMMLPAAQPEIVRCEDCKHYNAGFECLIEGYGVERNSDWFCGDAERREDG